jgi:beta-1,4-mannosyl-glycoprotein beta-1,4-N-acetylglucosaminyltransferase
MARIFDCFLFFNELDVLDIRLHELAPIVDRFVLAEARLTFSGRDKPLYFHQNRERFAPFLDRIVHVIVDDMPTGGDRREREHHQRNALIRGLGEAEADDLVIISDVDEIPRAESVSKAAGMGGLIPKIHLFELRWFWWFLNFERPTRWLRHGPRMTHRKHLRQMSQLRWIPHYDEGFRWRFSRWRRSSFALGRPVRHVMHRDAGWHFSYAMDINGIAEKLKAFSHIVPPEQCEPAWIARRVAAGRSYDPDDHDRFALRPIDDTFPRRVRSTPDRFRHLIADQATLDRLCAPAAPR